MSLAVIGMSFIAAFFAQLVETTVSNEESVEAALSCKFDFKSTHVILAGFVQNKH